MIASVEGSFAISSVSASLRVHRRCHNVSEDRYRSKSEAIAKRPPDDFSHDEYTLVPNMVLRPREKYQWPYFLDGNVSHTIVDKLIMCFSLTSAHGYAQAGWAKRKTHQA